MCGIPSVDPNPEIRLAEEFKHELNVDINPQALRMFIRSRWGRISVLAHAIHDAGKSQKNETKKASKRETYTPVGYEDEGDWF